MKISFKSFAYALFLSPFCAVQAWGQTSEGVDFSCMREMVRPIIQVTDQHREFDLVVRNECPGAVNWAMCVERLDPWTHRVLETHNPVGYVEADKRSRVNLQMKATPSPDGYETRAQEFYMTVAYSIQGQPQAPCVARACEAKKQALRAEQSANSKAWRQARQALEARVESECPAHGWNTDDVVACRQAVVDAAAEQMTAYAETDKAVRDQMNAIDPETCTVHGGQILKLPES